MAKWIEFRLVQRYPERRTDQWEVITTSSCETVGLVKWFGRWRAYAFFPNPETVYERQCLRDIADFCEKETYKHREKHADNYVKLVDA